MILETCGQCGQQELSEKMITVLVPRHDSGPLEKRVCMKCRFHIQTENTTESSLLRG